MSENDALLERLRGIYGRARPLTERLARAYRGERTPSPQERQLPPRPQPPQETRGPRIFFTEDAAHNAEIVDRIIARVPTIERMLTGGANDEIYEKLIGQYRTKLEDLKRKASRGERAAKGALDCVKTTILKMADNGRFGAAVAAHLSEAGFELMSFSPGHKLTDDDLEMLDERRMTSVRTDDRAKSMTVIEMTQPIVMASYDDEGERRRSVLPGVCKVWS